MKPTRPPNKRQRLGEKKLKLVETDYSGETAKKPNLFEFLLASGNQQLAEVDRNFLSVRFDHDLREKMDSIKDCCC